MNQSAMTTDGTMTSRFNADKPTANERYAKHRERCINCSMVDAREGGSGRCMTGKELVHAASKHLKVHSFEPCMCPLPDCYCLSEYDLPISFAGADSIMLRLLREMQA